jgi:hypothetical protein
MSSEMLILFKLSLFKNKMINFALLVHKYKV